MLFHSGAVALCFTVSSDGGLGKSGVIFLLWLFQILSCLPLSGKAVLELGEALHALDAAGALSCVPDQCLFQVLYDQNRTLRRELQRLRLQLQESRAEGGLPAAGNVQEGSVPILSARTAFPLDPS